MRKKRVRRAALGLAVLALTGWILWGNLSIQCTELQVQSGNLPAAFAGYTIAQVSDLHNAEFGREMRGCWKKLRQAEPDLIALTGIWWTPAAPDLECALVFVREAVQIAPVYYVTGNHESRIADYPALEAAMDRRA